MQCPYCQKAVDSGAVFCGNCGKALLLGGPSAAANAVPSSPQPSPVQVNTSPLEAASPTDVSEASPGPGLSPPVYPPAPPPPQAVVTPSSPVGQQPETPQPTSDAARPAPLQQGYPTNSTITNYDPSQPPLPLPVNGSNTVVDHSGKAIASFVLGVLGLPAVLIPVVGIVFGILAIVFGTLSIHSARKVFAIIGMSLAVIVLLASLFFWVRNTQELVTQHKQGVSLTDAKDTGPKQAITTPCYTTEVPAYMKITQTSGSCTFLGSSIEHGEQQQVKVMQVPGLTLSNLSSAAKADAANVVGSIPGGSITSQRSATFAGSQAYEVEVKATDGSAGIISYVYNTTAQGNMVIILHTQARASGDNYDLSSIEAKWAWQ